MEMFRKRQQELAAKAKQGQGTAQQGAPAQPGPAAIAGAPGSTRQQASRGSGRAGFLGAAFSFSEVIGIAEGPEQPSNGQWRIGAAKVSRLMLRHVAEAEHAIAQILEQFGNLRVSQRLIGLVGQQVLFRNISHVLGLGVLRQEMVERLILGGPDVGMDLYHSSVLAKVGPHRR